MLFETILKKQAAFAREVAANRGKEKSAKKAGTAPSASPKKPDLRIVQGEGRRSERAVQRVVYALKDDVDMADLTPAIPPPPPDVEIELEPDPFPLRAKAETTPAPAPAFEPEPALAPAPRVRKAQSEGKTTRTCGIELPAALHSELHARARKNNVSLKAEIVRLLERAVRFEV